MFSLQCEIKLVPKRLRLESRPGDEDEGEDDSDSDDENSAKDRYFSYLKQGLYFVTEMERFAPPRKRPRTITKNFRLVSLRSTTPEELYQRKVSTEGKVVSDNELYLDILKKKKQLLKIVVILGIEFRHIFLGGFISESGLCYLM